VLIRDPKGKFKTQALLCTDLTITPVQIIRWFVLRWQLEIVQSQMTKTHVFATGISRDHITDLDFIVRDHDPINEQLHQRALLLKRRMRQAVLDSLAEGFDGHRQARQFGLAIYVRLQLLGLGLQRLAFLFQFAAAALKLRQRNDAVQIGFTQSVQLMVKVDPPFAQLFAADLQFLRQPVAAMRTLQGMRDEFRMRQDCAQILPNQFIQLLGRNEASGTTLVPAGLTRRRLAPADVVEILSLPTPRTSQMAHPATHQRAQQVVVGRVVAPGELLIVLELGLHLVKNLRADHRGSSRPGAISRAAPVSARTPVGQSGGSPNGDGAACAIGCGPCTPVRYTPDWSKFRAPSPDSSGAGHGAKEFPRLADAGSNLPNWPGHPNTTQTFPGG
jgi:hypothetical protein